MPIPDFQSFFKPIFDSAADGQEYSLREVRQKVASLMQLSEPLLSGIQVGTSLPRKILTKDGECPGNALGIGNMFPDFGSPGRWQVLPGRLACCEKGGMAGVTEYSEKTA